MYDGQKKVIGVLQGGQIVLIIESLSPASVGNDRSNYSSEKRTNSACSNDCQFDRLPESNFACVMRISGCSCPVLRQMSMYVA